MVGMLATSGRYIFIILLPSARFLNKYLSYPVDITLCCDVKIYVCFSSKLPFKNCKTSEWFSNVPTVRENDSSKKKKKVYSGGVHIYTLKQCILQHF